MSSSPPVVVRPPERGVYLSRHAIESYERFYPPDRVWPDDRTYRDHIRESIEAASPIDRPMVEALCGRRAPRATSGGPAAVDASVYRLHAERTGIWVLTADSEVTRSSGYDFVAVTFLRFVSLRQHEEAVKAYGFGAVATGANIPYRTLTEVCGDGPADKARGSAGNPAGTAPKFSPEARRIVQRAAALSGRAHGELVRAIVAGDVTRVEAPRCEDGPSYTWDVEVDRSHGYPFVRVRIGAPVG